MSINSAGRYPRTTALPSSRGRELFHGRAQPSTADIPSPESVESVEERAELSSVLITRVTNLVVITNDKLPLGYSFKNRAPNTIASINELQEWIQAECHTALDKLIVEDPHLALLADRYEDLVMPQFDQGQHSLESTRRDTLMFQQAVAEPHNWLKIAAIAADYCDLFIPSLEILPFLTGKLKEMQLSSRQDISRQEVRGAILEAAIAFGSMVTPDDEKETELKYQVLLSYVAVQTGHKLRAKTFGELYGVSLDSGFTFTEKDEGFGSIDPKRERPVACPASYSFAPSPEASVSRSALYRLLCAGIATMKQKDLFREAMSVKITPVPDAFAALDKKIKQKQLLDQAAKLKTELKL